MFFPHLSSFFWERKKKDAPERRKKNRGRFLTARRKRARISRRAVLGTGNSRESSRKCVFSFLFAKIECQKSECLVCLQKKWSKKPSRPKRAEGGQASACRQTKGIFCESRIFVGDTGDDSTSLTCHLQSFLPLGRPFGFFWSTNRIGIFCCNQKILCDIHLCSLCCVMSHGGEAERNVKKKEILRNISVLIKR